MILSHSNLKQVRSGILFTSIGCKSGKKSKMSFKKNREMPIILDICFHKYGFP